MELTFLYNIGALILEWAHQNRVQAEAFIQQKNSVQLRLDLRGEMEKTQLAETFGLGVRIIDEQQRGGFAGTTNLHREAVLETLENAKLIAALSTPDEHLSFPQDTTRYPKLKIFSASLAELLPNQKIELLHDTYEKALSIPGIKSVSRSGYNESENKIIIINTNGLNTYGHSNQVSLFTTVMAEDKNYRQNGSYQISVRSPKHLNPAQVAQKAAQQALALLGYEQIPSTVCPVVLAPEVTADFLQLLAPSFSGANARKRKSHWQQAEQQIVATPLVNIFDDPTDVGGMGAFPFDGEGVPTRPLALIENGQLQTLLYDHLNAAYTGHTSTGSAVRGSFFAPPVPGAINLKWLPGTTDAQHIYADVDYGVYITTVMGLHTANAVSGNFSLGAKGFLIEQGQLRKPLGEITLAGNLFELLENVTAVGDDFTWFGNTGAPTVKIARLNIGGQ